MKENTPNLSGRKQTGRGKREKKEKIKQQENKDKKEQRNRERLGSEEDLFEVVKVNSVTRWTNQLQGF